MGLSSLIRWVMAGVAVAGACAADVASAGVIEAKRPRVALVIGNDDYQSLPKQRCAVSDAHMVAKALAESGFEVWLARNLGGARTVTALQSFARAAAGGDAVLYFSGHGARLEGEDVIVPVDVSLEGALDTLREWVIRVADVQSFFVEEGSRTSLALWLDIDRPSIGRKGLQPMRAERAVPLGQFVLFAAQTGSHAFDCAGGAKEGEAGAFAATLSQEIRVPGATMAQVARQVRQRVAERTQGDQMQRPEFIDHSARDLVLGLPDSLVKGRVVDIEDEVPWQRAR